MVLVVHNEHRYFGIELESRFDVVSGWEIYLDRRRLRFLRNLVNGRCDDGTTF